MNRGYAVATLNRERTRLTSAELSDLDARVAGDLLCPADDGWGEAVQRWNGMVETMPALVLQPESAEDVGTAVRFAREREILLSVKGGGHNIAGTAVADGGLMLDMSRMRKVVVDPEASLAHVEAGCRLGEVDRATQQHGLATVLGFISRTGVAGLTLGGGLGYLTRRFGWTVDNLQAVELVTADGRLRRASRSEDAELFWAIRGGGGNFGVITRFTFRLHAVGPTVFGGLIAWPFARADEILAGYRSLTTTAPRELSVWLVLLHAPPAPFVPPQWHGAKICAMAVCFTGDLSRIDGVIRPVRELGTPLFDLLQERPYTEIQSYLDDSEPDGMHYYWKTEYATELSDRLLSTLRDRFAACAIPGADFGILHLGGALNDRAWDDGAVGNRDIRYAIGLKARWAPGTTDAGAFRPWIRDAWEQIRPCTAGRTYVNFQTMDEAEERVRATYGANWDRLVRLKTRLDPQNLFRCNRNIAPVPVAAPRPH